MNTTTSTPLNATRPPAEEYEYNPPEDPTTIVHDFTTRPSISHRYISVVPYDTLYTAIAEAARYNLEPDDPVHDQISAFTKIYGDQTVGFDMVGLKEGDNNRGIYYDDLGGLMVRAIQGYRDWIGLGRDLPQAEIEFETEGGDLLAGQGSLFVVANAVASA